MFRPAHLPVLINITSKHLKKRGITCIFQRNMKSRRFIWTHVQMMRALKNVRANNVNIVCMGCCWKHSRKNLVCRLLECDGCTFETEEQLFSFLWSLTVLCMQPRYWKMDREKRSSFGCLIWTVPGVGRGLPGEVFKAIKTYEMNFGATHFENSSRKQY